MAALHALKAMVKPGGTITVIEGDHGSAYFQPRSEFATRAVQCLVDLQARAHGDALIGRALYPLLVGFTRKTFTAMIEGVRTPAIDAGLMSAADFDRGIADLYRTADDDGVFCYTFFKARAIARP